MPILSGSCWEQGAGHEVLEVFVGLVARSGDQGDVRHRKARCHEGSTDEVVAARFRSQRSDFTACWRCQIARCIFREVADFNISSRKSVVRSGSSSLAGSAL